MRYVIAYGRFWYGFLIGDRPELLVGPIVGLAMAMFDASDALTPLTRWSTELVSAAAAATPDLDITAVARPYRRGKRSPGADTGTTPSVQAAG